MLSWIIGWAAMVLTGLLQAQTLEAPPLQLAVPPGRLSTTPRLKVREFRFEGNRVFSSSQLATVTSAWVGREITSEELEAARRAVTEYYVAHGYINSGAILPDQDPRDGVVTMRIMEGVVSDVKVVGNRWLRDSYVIDRLKRWSGPPVNVNEVKQGLEILRQNPNVNRINAELSPGTAPGKSVLDVHLEDQNPFRLALQVDNYRPPSVDEYEILMMAGDANLTGHSDPIEVCYGIAQGSNDGGFKFSDWGNLSGSYTIPVTRFDTTIRVFGNKNDYTVIQEPYNPLDVTSDSYHVGGMIRQPVYQTANRELALSVTFEREHSKSFLLGEPFDVTPGSSNGVTDISALRISQEWVDRNQNHVLAFRSRFSVGLDAFDATDIGTKPNAKFFSWLGQAQYVCRLFGTPNQLILRTDAQLTDQRLLSLEQFTLGGANSVRGYEENQIVRDEGFFSSVEFRLPVIFNGRGDPVVQFAPFFDVGGAWNVNSSTPDPKTIYSAGVGLLLTPNRHLNAQIYWGHGFRSVNNPDNNLQDLGINFKLTCVLF